MKIERDPGGIEDHECLEKDNRTFCDKLCCRKKDRNAHKNLLSARQVEIAKLRIEKENQPLKETPLYIIFPFLVGKLLYPCIGCLQKNSHVNMLDVDQQDDDDQINKVKSAVGQEEDEFGMTRTGSVAIL